VYTAVNIPERPAATSAQNGEETKFCALISGVYVGLKDIR